MERLLNRLVHAARHYSITDFVFFKLCLLSIGVLAGYYLSGYAYFSRIISIIWIIAIVSCLIMIIRTIRLSKSNYKKET